MRDVGPPGFWRVGSARAVHQEDADHQSHAWAGLRLDAESALALLTPTLREALVLRVFAGLPVEAVAEVLRIPAGTVKSRTHEAYRQLREVMHDPA